MFEKSTPATYDTIGVGYAHQRRPDPRIAAQIWRALGDARRICNVGAGAGSYEPLDRDVIAIEPSRQMLAQRISRPSCRVVRARAEALPFADDAFDAVMALLTVHHWEDLEAGVGELRRIAPLRILFTFDPAHQSDFWLVRDYLPEIQAFEDTRAATIARLVELLGGAEVTPVLVPWDCTDGFQAAYWRRPEAYLDPAVRASISTFAMLPEEVTERAIGRLESDLATGAWHARYGELLGREMMDFSYRLIVSRAG
jgi:SAM-dependent methyltransferase